MKSSVRNFIILLVLCFLLLLTPYLYRHQIASNSLIGDDSYYFLRLAETQSFIYDSLSFGGRFVVMELGWPFLLSFYPLFFSWFLPVAFGLLSFVLFYFILGHLKDEKLRGVCTLLFIISPIFLYFFTVSNNYAPALFLTLFGFYLLLEKKYYLCGIFLGLVSLFSVLFFIVNSILFLSYIFLKERELFKYFFISVGIGLTFVILQFWRVYWFGLHFSLNYNLNLITDFGAKYGIGFFILLLALLGIFFRRHFWVYLLLTLGFVLSGYFNLLIVYINFILIFYAGSMILELLKLKWTFNLLKNVTFLVIICCLIFSSVAYVREYVNYYPNESTLKGIDFLKNKRDVVFSEISRGHWITYAGAKSFIDGDYYFVPDYNARVQTYNQLLFSKNYEEFINLIKSNNIKYFWIDKQIRDRIYGGETEGMLFWLRYGNDFKLVYSNTDLQIWQFDEKA